MTSNASNSTIRSERNAGGGPEYEHGNSSCYGLHEAGVRPVQCRLPGLGQGRHSYESVDVPASPEALEYVHDLGYSQAPVVAVNADDENHWSGFRPDKIGQLAGALKLECPQ